MNHRHLPVDLRLARSVVIGTGRRRAMLLLLFAVPVLLATAAASVVDTLNLSPQQLATAAMARADLQVDRTEPGPAPADLAALVGPLPTGTAAVPYYRAPEVPVVLGGLTGYAAYRESDWTAAATRGWLRATAGRLPAGPAEAALSGRLAAGHHLGIGDTLRFRGSATPAVVVGLVEDPTAHDAEFVAGGPGLFETWSDPAHPAESGVTRGWLVTGPDAARLIGPRAAQLHLAVRTRPQVASAARTLLAAQPGLVALPGLLLVLAGSAAAFGIRMRRLQRQFGLLSAVGFDGARLVRLARAAGLLAAAVGGSLGVLLGTALGAALRPTVRAAVHRDLAPVDLTSLRPLLLLVATVLCGALGVWLPARLAAGHTVRRRLSRVPVDTAGRRRRRSAAVCGALAAVAITGGAVAGSSTPGVAGGLALLAATLLVVPDLLVLLGRAAAPLGPGPRFGLRDLARDRRRPAAAVVFGVVTVAFAASTAVFVGSNTARDAREYAGSRHPGQIEVVLRDAPPSDAVEAAVRRTVGARASVVQVRGVYAADRPAADAPSRLALPKVALLARSAQAANPHGTLQIVETEADFRALALRDRTADEAAALTAGKVVVFDPGFVRDGSAVLAFEPTPGAAGRPPLTVAARPGAAVDRTTRNRAAGVLTGAAARGLGLFPVTTTYLVTPEEALPPGIERRLGTALEPLGIPATALRIEPPHTRSVPARWNVMTAIAGAAVLVATLLAVSASTQELRPRLRLLHVIGFGGRTQRLVSATQATAITSLSLGCGLLTGLVLAGAQLWPKGTALVVPWASLTAATAGLITAAALAGYLVPPAATRTRSRSTG
ncbi:FtsX-like permease family protein [Streptomyces sp. NRRL B-24484]|uniref:FtsX-like permease family protein n=1 Tax=Streptomyces sp. NRRL B-24484 TaxID=1463833 RepID=UPI0004C0B089|nr:FtsX-like permease family protein [Streptomyces sp. NRRL B-24484]